MGWTSRISNPSTGKKFFSPPKRSNRFWGATPPPIQWAPGFCSGGKATGAWSWPLTYSSCRYIPLWRESLPFTAPGSHWTAATSALRFVICFTTSLSLSLSLCSFVMLCVAAEFGLRRRMVALDIDYVLLRGFPIWKCRIRLGSR
jgi:hypothetical protein